MKKREDGLEKVFWPYYIGAAIICAVLGCVYHWNVWMWLGMFVCWSVTLLLAWVLFILVLSWTVDLNKPVREDHPGARFIILSIIGVLCRIGRLRIHVTGWENIPEGRFLLVGNHRSNYDPILTIWALRQKGINIAFITKPENMKIPLVRYIHMGNYLVIDRDDPRKAIATINEAAELLRNDVVSVGVYPEGTRSRGRAMLPFHNAIFKIAQKAKVPMVVAAVTGTENIARNMPWRHTDVYLDFCACLPDAAAMSTKDMSLRTQELLTAAMGDD